MTHTIRRRIQPYLRIALLAPSALIAFGCGADSPSPRDVQTDPLSRVASADAPGRGAFDAMYVGADETQTFALAVGVAEDGSVVAYACDGVGKGLWLKGSWEDAATDRPLVLTTAGSALTLPPSIIPRRGSGAEDLDAILPRRTQPAAASLSLPGTDAAELHFELEAGNAVAGMHRFTDADADGSRTIGWVALNDGRIFGVDSDGGAVKSREVTLGNVTEDSVAVGGAGGADEATDEYLFNRMRCGRVVLRMSRAVGNAVATGSTERVDWDPCAEMRALHCTEYGFGMPHFC